MRLLASVGQCSGLARSLAAVSLVFSILASVRVSAAEPAGAMFKAGVAVRVITPKKPLWMSGYGNRTKAAEGKFQDLYVKALALEDSAGGRLVLLTSDLVGFQRPFAEAVAEEVRRRTGLPRERLLLTASHTHSGPMLRGPFVDHFDLPSEQVKNIEEYTDRLSGWMVEVVVAALADLRPARLAFGQGTARFAMNRRGPGGYNAEGPVDRDVPVLRVESPEGKLRAVVFGYACHNVTLQEAAVYYRWSGDYAGFAQAYLEEKHPGATALFWCGCGGDIRPRPLGTLAICRQHGRELTDAVEGVLAGSMTPVRGETAARYSLVSLPFGSLPSREKLLTERSSKRIDQRKRAIRLLKMLDEGGKIDDHYASYPVQVWRLGDGPLWVSLGGEVVADYALRLKRELGRERPLWVTAYANDVMAYIPSRRVLKEGGYEGDTSMVVYGMPTKWAPPVEEKIVAQVNDLVQEVAPQKAEGEKWTPLFNGRDLTGWRPFVDPKAKVAPEKIWSVRDGAIICEGSVEGYLATEKEFENYQLRLEWRWGEKVARSRGSSVFVHVTGPNKIWPKGADVTLGAGGAGQFWLVGGLQLKVDPRRRDPKAERHYFAMRKDVEKPLGEWNQCDITCRGGTIRARINGVLVNEGTEAEPSKGHIILLSEGAEIHFRKIEMRALGQ